MTNVTKVDGGYLHEWIDADGEHHKYVHPTSLTHPAPSGQAVAETLLIDLATRPIIDGINYRALFREFQERALSALVHPVQPGWRELREAFEAARYVPGDHPIVPVKIDRFMKTVERILFAAPQPKGE
jgi:hypothetical protein